MWARLRSFAARDDGQDLIEYALLVALLSVVSIFGLSVLRGDMFWNWVKIIRPWWRW